MKRLALLSLLVLVAACSDTKKRPRPRDNGTAVDRPGEVTPPPPANRPPTVQARCEPCTVQVGQTSTVTADAQDPDGDPLTYRWTAPSGSFQNPADRQTVWTAPQQEGPVQTTVTVNDGRGGTASSQVTIQVVRPPVLELTGRLLLGLETDTSLL